jgi:hypothetical protein
MINKSNIIKETNWIKCYDLKGQEMFVKTIWIKDKSGKIYTTRKAVRKIRTA